MKQKKRIVPVALRMIIRCKCRYTRMKHTNSGEKEKGKERRNLQQFCLRPSKQKLPNTKELVPISKRGNVLVPRGGEKSSKVRTAR